MKRTLLTYRHGLAILTIMATLAAPAIASGGLGQLNRRIDDVEPQVEEAISSPAAAPGVIQQLNEAEADFEQTLAGSRNDREELLATYSRLESLLSRIYSAYQKKKDACVAQIDAGGADCDYDQPEQIALTALYPLSWLRYQGALLYAEEPSLARPLLNQAIDGFTNSTLLIVSPELVRENILGRAFCERELGKYDRSEYGHAIADFRQVMRDGYGTRQYRAAEQGLAATYAQMGKTGEAANLTGDLASGASGQSRQGLEMLRLRELFEAEAAATDSAKRADFHNKAVEYIRVRQNDKQDWAVSLSAISQYVRDPVAEFGDSSDPFEKWLLANVLYYKHQVMPAAHYFAAAAATGRYPQGYKYAAEIYYAAGRTDLVEQLVDQVAQQRGNPDAQWAAYMRYKLPRTEWEHGGQRNTRLEAQWVAAGEDYLNSYPHGQYAYEPRFRLAERLQKKADYAEAAKLYAQVSGSPDYDYTAVFNAAECNYMMVAAAEKAAAQNPKAPEPAATTALRAAAIKGLRDAISREPMAQRLAPGQRAFFHDMRGRAIYMLASLEEHHGSVDDKEMADLLEGYENDYPDMKEHFNEIFEWRLKSQVAMGRYPDLERDVAAMVNRNSGNLAANDFIKEIGVDFWKQAQAALVRGDQTAYVANARLTALTYAWFQNMVNAGKIPAKDLTGTLSILGEAYAAMGQTDQAEATFNEVVKADPASPDANAGLARIAQSRKDYKDAIDLWSRVEQVAAQSDSVWYEAGFNVATIYAAQGDVNDACKQLASTRSEHPSLGSPEMKTQWIGLQNRICADHKPAES